MENEYISVAAYAAASGVSRQTVYSVIKNHADELGNHAMPGKNGILLDPEAVKMLDEIRGKRADVEVIGDRDSIPTLRRENAELHKLLSDARGQILDLRDKLDNVDARLAQYDRAIEDKHQAEEARKQAEVAAAVADQKMREAEEQKRQAEEDKRQAEEHLAALTAEQASLQDQIRTYTEDMQKTSAALEQIRTAADQTEKELHESTAQNEALNQKCNSMEDQLETYILEYTKKIPLLQDLLIQEEKSNAEIKIVKEMPIIKHFLKKLDYYPTEDLKNTISRMQAELEQWKKELAAFKTSKP